jgi:plasmid stabilization system protein ParE
VEHYSIVVEPEAQRDLESIFQFISLNDTAIKAENFLQELKAQITTLDSLPFRCRKSYYTKESDTYDMIYKGYTIVYRVIGNKVHILTIFRQKNY